MNYRERVTIDPEIRSGKPCIRGARIAVADVFDYLGGGMTIAEFLMISPTKPPTTSKPALPSLPTVSAGWRLLPMKLLFDENLSPKLPRLFAAQFPGSLHLRDCGWRDYRA
jgi:hypothetical protein